MNKLTKTFEEIVGGHLLKDCAVGDCKCDISKLINAVQEYNKQIN